MSRKVKPQDEADNANDEVFIFHNITDRDLAKDNFMPEFEQSIIKCPRCKYIYDHAKKFLDNVKYINKFEIISFCNYCQTKDQKNMPCNHCRQVINKFFANQEQNPKGENILWQKINKNTIKITHISKHKQSRSLSDLHLNKQYHNTWSPKSFHQPRIDQLLDLITRKVEGNLLFGEQQGLDSHLKRKIYHSDGNLNLIDQSDMSISKPKHLRFSSEIIYSSQSLIDLNSLKPKNIRHRKYISYPSSYFDDKISEDLSIYKSYKYDIPKKSVPSHSPTLTHILQEDVKSQRTSERIALTDLKDMITTSERAIVNFDAVIAQRRLHKDFSFFFVKKLDDEYTLPRKCKSSSELIKDTQDMIKERDKKEQERQEENEKKRLELEQRKLEKKKEKKNLEEIKNKERKDKEKKELPPKEEVHKEEPPKEEKVTNKEKEKQVVDKRSKKTKELSKTSLVASKKDKVIKPKSEPKKIVETPATQHKPKNKEFIKAQNETEKVTKTDKPQIVKEQKIKEKEVKESINKEQEPRKEKDQKTLEKGTGKEEHQDEFKKMLAEQKKQKEEELKLKKKLEEENIKKLQMAAKAEKIAKPEPELKDKNVKEIKTDKKSKTKTDTVVEQTDEKELDFKQIAIRKPSCDDLILRLVKLKQSEPREIKVRPTRLSDIKIKPFMVTAHKGHKNKKLSDCVICNDSQLELDIENILRGKTDTEDMAEIIIGQKILKFKPPLEEKRQDNTRAPILFTSTLQDDIVTSGAMGDVHKKALPIRKVEQVEVPKGVIRYALSDRSFIDKGWTMLPTEKVVRKMNVYRMRPAHPEFDWFEHNKNKKLMSYDTGEKLAEFDDNGRGRWFYRNGRLALDYYDAEEINAQQRFVIYSSGEPDERGRSRPLAILATFDYLGNGIVFDHAGKIRLKYNQTEGVVLDRNIGPVSHWKWHTLNDPPVLQQIMIDTQMAHKDPDIYKLGGPGEDKPRADNEEMLAIEFDNFIKEKSKKLSQKFKPFQIKMKALKINEHFSLKVLDQASVYLIFRDGSTNLKINIGMILDHQEIVDTDTAEVGEVSNSLEKFPARTDSLAGLQKSVEYAQRVERARIERERRLRPIKESASVDKVNAMVSRPLRTPLHIAPSSSTAATTGYNCRCRKPTSCNLYYDARLS